MNKLKTAAGLGILGACVAGAVCRRRRRRFPLEEYTQYALYMAVMDDEICRNELEGNWINGEEIRFPPKMESLQQRYHMFLRWNRRKSREDIQAEVARMEEWLEESRQYLEQPKEELTVSFQGAD